MANFRLLVHKNGYIEVTDFGSELQYVSSDNILFLVDRVNDAVEQRNALIEENEALLKKQKELILENDRILNEKRKALAQRDDAIYDVDQIIECLKNVSDIIEDYKTNSLHHAKTLDLHRMKFPILWHEIDTMVRLYRQKAGKNNG
jgi:hypothetical protein